MSATVWFVVVGALLVGMGVATRYIERLPLTTAMIYFAVGFAMDPAGVSFTALDPVRHPHVLERVTEVAVLVSLFTAGLKLRAPFAGRGAEARWKTPVRLATLSMVVTVAVVTAAAYWGLGLPFGGAVLLAGILAPTDPVLASDVQVEHGEDRDRLRFALTGEASLNDGTAFPVVYLGLGLLGLRDLGAWRWKWLAVDVVWGSLGGLAVGGALGWLVGRFVLRLRRDRPGIAFTHDLIALGLVGLSYGLALAVHAAGFLAVFAAGLMLRHAEERDAEAPPAAAPAPPPRAFMVEGALGVSEQLERIGEAGVLLVLGGLFAQRHVAPDVWWFAPALFLVARPLAVWLGTPLRRAPAVQRRLTMWFGIRGIGSLYYLTYAVAQGVPTPLAERIAALTMSVVLASLVVHGVSVTPLMRRYRAWAEGRGEARGAAAAG